MVALLAATSCREDSAGTKPAPSPSAAASATTAAASPPSSATSTARSKTAAVTPGQPLDADGRMVIGPDDRCPVCAMTVKKHAKFASAIQLQDDTTYYFCGTGCMLRTWLHPDALLNKPKKSLRRGVVQEYFTGEHRDAAGVIWVVGSDVVGPMGPAIVPLADEKSVDTFQKRHGGKATFKLGELDDAKWQELTGKKAGR